MKLRGLFRPAWVGLCLMGVITSAHGQEDLDRNKSAAQLFSSNCTACHRSPQGLAKNLGASGLPSFLRQHYTTGASMASSLAGYLTAAGDAPAGRAARAAVKPGEEAVQEGRRPGETAAQQRKREAKAKAKEQADKSAAAQVRERQPGEPATVTSDPDPIIIAIAPIPLAPDAHPRPTRMAPSAIPAYVVLPATRAQPETGTSNVPAGTPPAGAPTPTSTEATETRTAAASSGAGAGTRGSEAPPAAPPVQEGRDAAGQAVADQTGFAAPLP